MNGIVRQAVAERMTGRRPSVMRALAAAFAAARLTYRTLRR